MNKRQATISALIRKFLGKRNRPADPDIERLVAAFDSPDDRSKAEAITRALRDILQFPISEITVDSVISIEAHSSTKMTDEGFEALEKIFADSNLKRHILDNLRNGTSIRHLVNHLQVCRECGAA